MNSKIKNENVYGYVVQAVGPIIDVQFKEGALPSILTCLIVEKDENKTLTLEVEQHIGDDTVRCVAMGPTEGIVRGMKVLNTKNQHQVIRQERAATMTVRLWRDPVVWSGIKWQTTQLLLI